ncbi:MAG: endonuclease protein [Firmicutes bacterium]|nr:endonuclease protein [Bacillota bacterium]
MFSKLTDIQIKLAEQLLISVMKNEPYVEYNELGSRITPPIHHRQVGTNIGEISKLCYEFGLPFLSAKVVKKNTHVVGAGFNPFYKLYGIDTKELSARKLFKLECKKIRECQEWYKLADHLGIKIDLPRPNNDKTNVENTELEIRILPMSKDEEFPEWSVADMQKKYFLKNLIEKEGYYYYRKSGINSSDGSLVLFQFNNLIIAMARIIKNEKYNVPVDGLYYGAHIFDTDSITIFEPITFDEIYTIDNTMQPFSQVKQRINYKHLERILRLIESKQNAIIDEELQVNERPIYIGGDKNGITNTDRNYKGQECLKHKEDKCFLFEKEMSKSQTQYFIFDTSPKKSHHDLDFEIYSWSRKKYNKVQPGDLFLYRRPQSDSEIKNQFYFFGAGKVDQIKDKKNGEVDGVITKALPFADVVTQIQMDDLPWDFRHDSKTWGNIFNQYGMTKIKGDDFLRLVNLAFPSGLIDIDSDDLNTEKDLIHQFNAGNYSVDDSFASQKVRGSSQRVFARAVKINYGYRCAITGISDPRYLIGSHIIPWAKDKDKRLNPRNGICLSILLDKAFDIGDITITPEFIVKIATSLEDPLIRQFVGAFAGTKIKLPVRDCPDPDYLKWHNDNIFKG